MTGSNGIRAAKALMAFAQRRPRSGCSPSSAYKPLLVLWPRLNPYMGRTVVKDIPETDRLFHRGSALFLHSDVPFGLDPPRHCT